MSDKTEVYTYKRDADGSLYGHRPSRKYGGFAARGFQQAIAGIFSPGALLAGTAAFFAGRAVLLGELVPFAAAFAAATAVTFGRWGVLVTALLCAGVATVADGYRLASYVLLAILSYLSVQAVPPRYSGRWPVIPVLVFGLTICVKSAFSAFTGSTPYDYISILFEGVFAAVLAPVCIVAFSSAGKINGVKGLSTEEAVCLLGLTAGVIAGTGDLSAWYISAKGFLSRTIILLAALAGGAGLGAAAGAVVGVIPGLSYTVTPYLVGAYSFSGVMAGLGSVLGKMGVSLSFLASNIIMSVYFNNFESMESVIAETCLACIVFLLFPENLVRGIASAVVQEQAAAKPDNSAEDMRNAFREKLKDFSSIFREISAVFGETSALSEKKENEQGIKLLMGEIGKKVCSDCSMFRFCWEKEYYRTFQHMLDMFALTEVYGRVRASDIPEELKLRCARQRELTVTATCLYEAFKVDRYWRKKFLSGKALVGDQLRGMADVIEKIAGEFNIGVKDGGRADSVLKYKLRQLGIPVKEIITSDAGGRSEFSITMKSCRGDLDCRYRVAPIVSELMEQHFSATGCICEGLPGDSLCRFRLYQGTHYRVEVGAALAGKDGSPVSGDVFDFMQLKGGKFAAVLSDGMGAGEEAARESATAIALIRRMLEAGLDIETVIKSVNSVQALKKPEESFATVDMAIISLYSGQAEFIKIASPPTYIIRGGRLRSIRASSLPVGILSDIDISITEKKLASGDVIVMLTDGILAVGRESMDREEWITGVLRELNGLDPKEMAGLLLKLAQTGSGDDGPAPDDMAVVVIRVEKEKVLEIPR
ncbi:MAG: stage II sporulation protein E [Bacillota bacterium]